MSIQYTAPGFEHESSPIANRPGLLPLSWIWFVQEFRIKGSWFFPLNFIDKFRIQFRAVFFSNLIKMSGDELPTHKIFCNFFALSMQNKFCTFSPTMCLSIFEANTLSSHLSLGCCRNSRYALIVVNKSVEQQTFLVTPFESARKCLPSGWIKMSQTSITTVIHVWQACFRHGQPMSWWSPWSYTTGIPRGLTFSESKI